MDQIWGRMHAIGLAAQATKNSSTSLPHDGSNLPDPFYQAGGGGGVGGALLLVIRIKLL